MNLKISGVYYGWWIVAAAFLTGLYMAGVVFYGFTTVFEPITEDMGWSYAQVSLASSLRGIEAGLVAPVIGILVDRWGPRRLIFAGALFTFTGLILLSRTNSLTMFYGSFALIALGMSCSTATVLMTAVANWFRKNVGLATGIVASGFGCGGLLIPVIVKLIDLYEWRDAVTILAIGTLFTVLPLSFVFRHKPEQYGYLPDGQKEDGITFDTGPGMSPAAGKDLKMKQVLKSSAFWLITLAFTYFSLLVGAVITHVMPYLSSIGIARSMAGLVAAAIPITSIAGRLGLGWIGDRHDKKLIASAAFGVVGLGAFCFGYADIAGTWMLVPFLILFGVSYGGCIVLRASLVREYFGTTSFGTIFGLILGINMVGSIIGPPLAGWVYDSWGSYQNIWFIFAGLAGPALVALLAMRPVNKDLVH
ncbi:MFS transporter [Chloroflexota bacterium]